MERIRLDIIPKGLMPVCHASQYDAGRVIRLDLMDGLQGYSLTDEEIELDVRKPDGHIVTASVDVVAGNTFVDIVTTEQMCAVEGENICELKISKDGAEIYSLNFRMMVEKSVTEGGDPSESFIHNLNQQIYDAVADQYEGNVIFDDVPTENHGTGYTVTSEGIKNAISEATPDNLSDLNDVSISSPTNNQALVWDDENNVWTNGEVSTVGSIDDLNDVDTTGKANGDSLRYDGNEWVAKPTTYQIDKADFDQISDFTPYANSHIVVPDEANLNPDASDIEYSSGVTVKQAIDTLKTTTTGTCTVNATNCNSGNVSYAKSGNVITVGGYIYTKGTWSSTATPIFELPYKPLIDLNPTAQTVISGDNYKTTYLNVSSSFFNVRLDNSVENNQLLRFGFSYVANV